MAQHPIWRGHLRLALVSCPVALYSANHEAGSLHFHLMNPKTGHRVRMVTLDAETDEELSRGDLVKGYEVRKDTYLLLTEEDFESARVDSSSTIKIDKFVDAGRIEPIYYDTSYYLAPDGEAGRDVYAVLRDAIAATGKMALARVVIARRERAVGILPLRDGLVLHTLHDERDLRDPGALFSDLPKGGTDPDMIALAKQLIDRQAGTYDPTDSEDRYETRLRAVIEARLKGEGFSPEEEDESNRGNVIDLMSALKRSLAEQGHAEQGHAEPAKPRAKAKTKTTTVTAAPTAKKPSARPARRRS